MNTVQPNKVLIVGAGLGGLCLAHGLRQAGIHVQVLERRSTPNEQPASYGIHLNADGLRALHACLPAESWARIVASATPARDVVRFWSPSLSTISTLDRQTHENASDPITRRRAVSRDALHDALLLGLNRRTDSEEDVIQWGKELVRHEDAAEGGVRVHFSDGTSAHGDLLVGADGSNSRVRKQRMPELTRQDLGVVNVAGRVPLSPALRSLLPEHLVDGSVNNIVPAGPGWTFVSTWPAARAPGASAAEHAPHVVWAWVGTRESYGPKLDEMTSAELRAHVLSNLSTWAPGLRAMVTETIEATIARVPLRTMPHLQPWSTTAVTLLGDAIHNMTPMAGIGANTALRDADQLRIALTMPGHAPLLDRVAIYEDAMRTYANQALAESTRNALNAGSRSTWRRTAFRTLLRVSEAIPWVHRTMFGMTSAEYAEVKAS